MMLVYVENLPKNVNQFRYLVVRAIDGKVWYYGAWFAHQAKEAQAQAVEVGGFVVENPAGDDPFADDFFAGVDF